jgi:hypothetical protein
MSVSPRCCSPVFALACHGAIPRKRSAQCTRKSGFRRGLAAITLLLAMGTPLNLPYFLVPGYSQTGNPARSLILLSLSLSVLAAIGLDALLRDGLSSGARRRAALSRRSSGDGSSGGSKSGSPVRGTECSRHSVRQLMEIAQPDILKGFVLLLLTTAALLVLPRLSSDRRLLGGAVLTGLAATDLYLGNRYNPSVPPALVYPVTPA